METYIVVFEHRVGGKYWQNTTSVRARSRDEAKKKAYDLEGWRVDYRVLRVNELKEI